MAKINYDQKPRPKLCRDCKHFSSASIMNSCWHEGNLGHDLVIGEREPMLEPYDLRNNVDLCSNYGNWWEPDDR